MLYMMYRVDGRAVFQVLRLCLSNGDERNIHCLAMKKVRLNP